MNKLKLYITQKQKKIKTKNKKLALFILLVLKDILRK